MNLINSTSTMKIINDINVVVPTSLQLMTPYILREQMDWFEDEIKFIRTYIKPGMQVLDIGANYGLYTLTIAKIVGQQGKVWAFEPTSTTATCLKQSISENNFKNIELIKAGLSSKIGKAKFFTDANSELNSLSEEFVSGKLHETILLLTLDHCAKKYNWGEIDFIKLDAEGEEANILKKSKKTLSSSSPLIMYELKHGEKINLSLINRFKSLGYDSYKLIPGLNVLIPFDPAKPFDGYLLNLFCCKQDKATFFESEQIIVKQWEETDCLLDTKALESYFAQFPFGRFLQDKHIMLNKKSSRDYLKILSSYILATSESTTNAVEKVGLLMTALNGIRNMLEKGEQRIERLTTFARIAFDAGERSLGVNILFTLLNNYGKTLDFEITEPFLPASKRYESIPPGNKIKEWLFSSILEEYIIKHAYSSYFTKRDSLPLLETLAKLGFIDEDMQRRETMIRNCFPL